MNIESYATEPVGKMQYRFFSDGKNGRFEMRICFERISHNLFNLAFGPWSERLKAIDDHIELRNGDMDIILATVAIKTMEFLDVHTDVSIYATGLVVPGKLAVRTRKYQMGINRNLSFLSKRHNIYGFKALEEDIPDLAGAWPFARSGKWEIFEPNSNYDAFLLNLK